MSHSNFRSVWLMATVRIPFMLSEGLYDIKINGPFCATSSLQIRRFCILD
jgi:hypothetical protein